MSRKTSLIEINGQLYDANSGRLFHHPRGPVIDGFRRKPQPSQIIKKDSGAPAPVDSGFSAARSHLHKPAQAIHNRSQHSKALMRSVVKRPINSKGLSGKLKRPKARIRMPSPVRISRAMNMIKNSSVDRFGKPVGIAKPALHGAALRSKPSLSDVIVGAQAASSTAIAVRPMPSMVTSVSHQRLERMLDEALIHADTHKKALSDRLAGKRRLSRHFRFLPRWLTITVVAFIVVSAGTYFAWRNVPGVSLKFTSLRSQVRGSVPAYVPSGFKFAGPVQYEDGALIMTFKSKSDGRSFTFLQKASNWNSSSLEANSLPNDAQVQTSQVKGTTVYFDKDNNASWVNNQISSKIKNDAGLTTDQIAKIAGSINL